MCHMSQAIADVCDEQASNMRIELRCRVVDVYMCYSGVLMLYMLRRVAMCVRPLTRVPRAAMCSDDVACRMYMYTCAPRPTRVPLPGDPVREVFAATRIASHDGAEVAAVRSALADALAQHVPR